MNFRVEVTARLKNDASSEARRALAMLEAEHLQAISSEPARTTAHEALRLWRTRLRNTKITHKDIAGLPELIQRLQAMTPQKKVDYFGFSGNETAVTLLFEKTSGTFIGSASTKTER